MRRLPLLVAILLGFAFAPFPAGPATASCVAPYLDVRALELRRGASVTITGEGFMDGCQDNGSCTSYLFGCTRCDYGPEPQPLEKIELTLTQGERTWDLGTADAGQDGRVSWKVTLPEDVGPGKASLTASGADDGGPVVATIR